MIKRHIALFEIKPNDPMWVKEIKAIEEIPDFDLEFGKRYLLEIYNKFGKDKFLDFMFRAIKAIDDYKELEALDLNEEEDEIFERLTLSVTLDKFLRSRGWLFYGAASLVEAFVLLFQSALLLYELKHRPHDQLDNIIISTDVAALAIGAPTEAFLFMLLKNTVKHETDDSKYEELQRAVLQLVNKFPSVLDENSKAAQEIRRRQLQEKQDILISI